MIDDSWIERINDECEELVSEGLGHYLVSNEAVSIRALIIRLRQAEKDAARYREIIERCRPMVVDASDWGREHDLILLRDIDEAINGSNN